MAVRHLYQDASDCLGLSLLLSLLFSLSVSPCDPLVESLLVSQSESLLEPFPALAPRECVVCLLWFKPRRLRKLHHRFF